MGFKVNETFHGKIKEDELKTLKDQIKALQDHLVEVDKRLSPPEEKK